MLPVIRHDGCGVPLTNVVVEPTSREGRYIVQGDILKEPMTRADWTTHDYNVHFCIGIENPDDNKCDIELRINGGQWEQLPNNDPLIFEAMTQNGPFHKAKIQGRTDLGKQYVLRFSLAPGVTNYVANHIPRCLEELEDDFCSLARSGEATEEVFGNTIEGRPLTAYTYGDPDKTPTILIVSGVHPPEPDTYASEEIMQWVNTPESSSLRQERSVVLVPIANPDGFANRTQAANAAGINFFCDFACDKPHECPEAFALWHLAERIRPQAYIDFHGYTFQLRKEPGPYVRPLQFYGADDVRTAAGSLYANMAQMEEFNPVTGFCTYAPQTFGSMLAKKFDTITVSKFHVHLKYGVEGCRRHGLSAFKAVAEAAKRLQRETTKDQVANINAMCRISRQIHEVWAGLVRPTIGRLRRAQFRKIDLTRRSIIHF